MNFFSNRIQNVYLEDSKILKCTPCQGQLNKKEYFQYLFSYMIVLGGMTQS